MSSLPIPAGGPAAAPAPRRRESSASWRLSDRVGLAFAWALGLLFCAITAAIVIFLLLQGIKYVRPSLLVTHPAIGFTESQTGGFLDPLIGTGLIAVVAMVLALPVGISIAVWLSEYRRPALLAPGHVREASYAVGKTKIATTRRVLLPAARPSVITGAMLCVGRVIGTPRSSSCCSARR